MQLQTFELSDSTAGIPIGTFIQRVGEGGVQVLDSAGNLLAYVIPPYDREALAYIDAHHDFIAHRDEIEAARKRRGGVTTQQLLENAEAARRKLEANQRQ